jgi:hypothetical protein
MPKKTIRDPLPHRLNVRLSDAEFAIYEAKKADAGLNTSQFFRECLLTNRTQIVARAATSSDRKQALFYMNKASNNLNQLAHVVNSERFIGRLSEGTFLSLLDSLQAVELLLKAHLSSVD